MLSRGFAQVSKVTAPSLQGRVGVGLLLLLLSSCSSSTPEPATDPIAIGFQAEVTASTRATGGGELTNALLQEKGFGVYCWYTGKTSVAFDATGTIPVNHISTYVGTDGYMLMRNQKVEYNTTTSRWTYAPTKYWPMDPDEKLTFRAYAPYSDYLLTDGKGMPELPVVVTKDDYHNNTQHDPLWGSGAASFTHTTDPYLPDDATYGTPYNNYTFEMSGDATSKGNHDGTIHWFFHHGMAKIIFWGLLDSGAKEDHVTITSISLTPLYTQGLLDISSPVSSKDEKPRWNTTGGNMEVVLKGYTLDAYGNEDTAAEDLSAYTIGKENTSLPNDGWTRLTDNGLLIIPRDYDPTTPMVLTVTGEAEGHEVSLSTTITQSLYGNTVYTFKMTISDKLTLQIQSVNAAFTDWYEVGSQEKKVYNW